MLFNEPCRELLNITVYDYSEWIVQFVDRDTAKVYTTGRESNRLTTNPVLVTTRKPTAN